MRIFTIAFICGIMTAAAALAQETPPAPCQPEDKACLLGQLESLTGEIQDTRWRDQTYRELAKLLAREKKTDKAIALVALIENNDTKAMTIRGIGMEAAKTDMRGDEFNAMFAVLRVEAEKIGHKPSYAIAMNYIADAQALSGDDAAAMKTAMALTDNAEMRNKALYDCAKIQAERDRPEAAAASVAAIDNPGFRDQGYRTVSKIFADAKKYEKALTATGSIENSYQKAQAVLYILAKQITPEEVSLVEE